MALPDAVAEAVGTAAHYAGTAAVTSSDATATFPASLTFTSGQAALPVTFGTVGEQDVTVTDAALTGTARTQVSEPEPPTQPGCGCQSSGPSQIFGLFGLAIVARRLTRRRLAR